MAFAAWQYFMFLVSFQTTKIESFFCYFTIAQRVMNKWYSLQKAAHLHSVEYVVCESHASFVYQQAQRTPIDVVWREQSRGLNLRARVLRNMAQIYPTNMYSEPLMTSFQIDVVTIFVLNFVIKRHRKAFVCNRIVPYYPSAPCIYTIKCMCVCWYDMLSCVGVCEFESIFTDAFLALIDVVVYIQNKMGHTSIGYACVHSQSASLQQQQQIRKERETQREREREYYVEKKCAKWLLAFISFYHEGAEDAAF